MPRAEGPFEVLERINDNVYKVDLPRDYGVSAPFNVADLSPFHPDDSPIDLRIKSFQQGQDDRVLPSHDLVHDVPGPERPRTRCQVQRMTHILQDSQTATTGLLGQKMPGFVHLIT